MAPFGKLYLARERDIADDNKLNLVFFESPSVRGLYDALDTWQKKTRKRLHSINIQKDGDMFSCIALTNPTEVIITDSGGDQAMVFQGALCVSTD